MPEGRAPDSAGLVAMDVETQEPLIRRRERLAHNRCNVALWSCFGVGLIFLVVMAAVFSGRRSGSPDPSTPQFPVPPGAVIGCTDSEALCLVAQPTPSPERDYRGHPRKVSGSRGVVASDQSRCADIGAEVLQDGGHAVDAAVAVSLCQGVVNPFASGVGGGHFAMIRLANGTTEFINAREVAPGAAGPNMYAGKGDSASLDGGLAIAVPLELRGLELAWRRHGRLPWARLVAPAAEIARHGFAAHPYFVYVVTGSFTFNRLLSDPLTRDAFLIPTRNGTYRAPRVGELCCRRPVLANTLDAVAQNGVSWLYEPERVARMAAEIQAAGGIVTAADFLTVEPRLETPLTYTLPGPVPYTLVVPPPPSSGAVLFLALSLVLGSNRSLTDMGPELSAHWQVEAMKHAFAVRNALGDPGTPSQPFTDVTAVLADIANSSFVEQLRSSINDTSVLPPYKYGGRWNPMISGGVSPEDHGTSHLAVLDEQGNAVSLTTTVTPPSAPTSFSKSTGILFNNEMDDFSRSDIPNKYGLPPAAANSIRPFKRPLSSMAPSLVLSPGGQLRLVVGASNGPRIITGIMQTILRVLYQDLDPLQAVSQSRLHDQWQQPDRCLYENYTLNGVTFTPDPAVIAGLASRGDNMVSYDDQLGDVQAILVDFANGVATAVADPRKDGAPAAAAE